MNWIQGFNTAEAKRRHGQSCEDSTISIRCSCGERVWLTDWVSTDSDARKYKYIMCHECKTITENPSYKPKE